MPVLDILDQDHRLRWDASCRLLATIMVPDDEELRRLYTAQLRLEKANGLPGGEPLLTRRDHVLAGKFRTRKRMRQMMQTRRIHSSLAGAMLWDLHTAVAAHSELASKSKVEFAIDRISIAQGKLGSLATLRDAWRQFRPVIHWCGAVAYQKHVFGSPFPQNPKYRGDVVICDFLALGSIFLTFAKEYVDCPAGQGPSFWTTPDIHTAAPHQRGLDWPDAHRLRDGITLSPEFLATASDYVIERDGVEREQLISGPGRRFAVAHDRQKK